MHQGAGSGLACHGLLSGETDARNGTQQKAQKLDGFWACRLAEGSCDGCDRQLVQILARLIPSSLA